MLKPLHTSKIDRALKLLGYEYTWKDVDSIVFEPEFIWIGLADAEWNNTVRTRNIGDAERDTYVKALRNLYGGDLNKVFNIEIFSDGYLVQVRTNVFDHAENEFVFEKHVGHLVVDE